MLKLDKRNGLRVTVLAAAMALLPLGAQAAGLGKLTVLSPLGQPLQAEMDLTATREELAALTAKVASAEAFKKAGVEYAPVLAGIRITVEKRADGRPFLRLQTTAPVNDPFIDLLVDVTWSSGRLVREYTFLLDPPEAMRAAPTVAPVAAPVVAPTSKPVAVEPAPAAPVAIEPAPAAVEEKAAPAAAKEPVRETPKAVPAEPPKEKAVPAPKSTDSRTVKRGDTLAKIAAETKPEGVSLDQMLVALFRSNKDAFDGGNMNRLKTGKILSVPAAESAAAVTPAEARKIVVAQAADFNAYRKKLAGAVAAATPAKDAAPKQESAGKITPKVEEKAAPAPAGKDQLAVSRTEAAKTAGRVTALEEDLVARDKALKEASGRIAELEKNINDLKRLAELKSQAGAQLQQQAQAAKAPEAKPASPAAVPAPAVAAAPAPTAETKPAEAPAPAEVKPADAAKPADTPKPADAPKPAAKPLPVPVPAPEPEPGFLDDNGLLVAGGGALLLGLVGFLGYSSWRRKKQSGGKDTTSKLPDDSLTANSVFGSTGGQNVDTSGSVSLQTDFSQSSMGAIDADEGVDPVAEADVYMAYGRDAQAEEILLDALKSDPTRRAVHLKLLEIYAGRKNAGQFGNVATELHGLTGGAGPDWDKAAALGRTVDPGNPLYGGKAEPEPALAAAPEVPTDEEPDFSAIAATTIVVPPSEAAKLSETVTMPGQLARIAAATEAVVPEEAAPPALDFDLDLSGAAPAAPAVKPAEEAVSLDFDLDLGSEPAAAPVVAEAPSFDFDLDLDTPAGAPVAGAAKSMVASAPPAAEAKMDFDFDLGSLGADASAPAFEPPALDVSPAAASDTDAGLAAATAPASLGEAGIASAEEENAEVATKLELAQAYEEMGDKEGAKELLQEVLAEGSPAQQEAARQKLATL